MDMLDVSKIELGVVGNWNLKAKIQSQWPIVRRIVFCQGVLFIVRRTLWMKMVGKSLSPIRGEGSKEE